MLKLVLAREVDLDPMVRAARPTTPVGAALAVSRFACRASTSTAYERLIALGARVRWTDLRMTLAARTGAARRSRGLSGRTGKCKTLGK